MSETPVDRARLRELAANAANGHHMLALLDELDRVERDLALVRGAMNADDERLRHAEARVWPDGRTYGCDAPQWLADAVLSLRAENMLMRERLAKLEQP